MFNLRRSKSLGGLSKRQNESLKKDFMEIAHIHNQLKKKKNFIDRKIDRELREINAKPDFCGIGNPPLGHRRATAQHCLDKKQVKLYGVQAVPPRMLRKHKLPALNPIQRKERLATNRELKLDKMRNDSKNVNNKIKLLQNTIADKKNRIGDRNKAKKQLEKLLIRQKKLVESIKKQKTLVNKSWVRGKTPLHITGNLFPQLGAGYY